MKCKIYVEINPFDKDVVLLALETGVDGVIVPDSYLDEVAGLARCEFMASSQVERVIFEKKADEIDYADRLRMNNSCANSLPVNSLAPTSVNILVLAKGWEIIPVENLLAQADIAAKVCLEVTNLDEAKLALGILEKGVSSLLLTKEALPKLREIINLSSVGTEKMELEKAQITCVRPVGLGHRVCVDTLSVLKKGQGMLTGNSSAFTFLVHAETEENNYVNSRPFRVNAGAVHAYAMMPEDKTSYLEELNSGDEVSIVSVDGTCEKAVVGRVKVEIRPMLLIEAVTASGKKGSVFLQNAETIRVVSALGEPVSVVALKEGDEILCHTDDAGRHFGMRVDENISE